MARTVTSKDLDTRTARRAIPIGTKIMMPLSQGRALGYRKGKSGGVWRARYRGSSVTAGKRSLDWQTTVLDADGARVLDFAQAQEKARTWFLTATTLATGEHVSDRGGYTV